MKATGILIDGPNLRQHADAPAWNGLLSAVDTRSAAIFTVNGVRCSAGGKLPNGLYLYQAKGNTIVKGVNVIR
jgi:hypothetical protein